MRYVDSDRARDTNPRTVATTLKRLFPNHHPHELRYTFITRCKECVQKGNQKIIIAPKQPKFNYPYTERIVVCTLFYIKTIR